MHTREIQRLFRTLGLAREIPGSNNGGDWSSSGDAWVEVSSPAGGPPLARVRASGASDYERVARSAEKAFLVWREVPAPKRGEIVRQIGEALRQKKDALGRLVSLEMGKILTEGLGEVQEMIDVCDYAVGLSRTLGGPTLQSERPRHRMMEQWLPLGPVGVISAFNFPVAVWSWNAAIAWVAGDTVVWKPSSKAPLAAIACQNVVRGVFGENGVQEGVSSVVIGSGRTVGERLIADPRMRLVSATGSTPMGRRVGEVVGARLGRALLELGGNNAVIVSDKADMRIALEAVFFGAVGTAGQRCTSTRRLILHTNIYDAFLRKLRALYRQVRIGDPLDPRVTMGPLVDEAAVTEFREAVARAEAEGGRVLHGGGVLRPRGGRRTFVEPTIIEMPPAAPALRIETFAPILYVLPYRALRRAIALHNAVPQGLSSSIFTDSVVEAEEFVSCCGSDCGIANVNVGTSGAEIGGAFGGEKDTGGGRESGSDAWKAYMRRQTQTVNWGGETHLAQGVAFGAKRRPQVPT
jgi:aldehyde dehydrogenase (NAD+)